MTYLLKMVQHTKFSEKNDGVNGVKDAFQDYVGIGEDHSMSFESKDVLHLAVEGVSFTAHETRTNGKESLSLTDLIQLTFFKRLFGWFPY